MMRGERHEHVRWTGRHVEAVPAVVTVCGPDSMGCLADLGKLIEQHDKGEP